MRTLGRPAYIYALLAVLAIVALRDVARLGDALPWRNMYDFPVFYCSGFALDQHANPYAYEPLHRCEHAVGTNDTTRFNPAIVYPAVAPPYDFPPMMALANLRYPAAKTLASILIVLALAGATVALVRLAIPIDLVVLSLAFSAAFLGLDEGQIVPFALLLLCSCGLALAMRRDAFAGVLAALTMLEPHAGLPVVLAVFLFVPKARAPILLTALALSAVALATVGFGTTLTYVTSVVPQQVTAEAHYPLQYSLTYAAGALGVPVAAAVALGNLSYAAFVALGIWIAPRTVMQTGRRELLAFLPAVAAVTGGPYVHTLQLCLAVPAALVLATSLEGRTRTAAALALCALAVPWIRIWSIKKLFAISLFIIATLLVRLGIEWSIVAGACIVFTAIAFTFELRPPIVSVHLAAPAANYRPTSSAEAPYRYFIEQLCSANPRWLAIKIPAWLALVTLLAVAGVNASRSRLLRRPQG